MSEPACTCTEAARRRGWSTECPVPAHRLRDRLGTEPALARAAADGAAKAEVRPGDQARPATADPAAPGAHDELLHLVAERRAFGLARYGTTLQPHNGRDTARDLADELVDGAVYALTLRRELADLEEALRRVVVDYGAVCSDPRQEPCACSMEQARALLRARGVTL